jgi:cytochrome P450
MAADVGLDPFTPAASLDPHPVYRRLRAEAPIHYQPSMDAWTVARHADVVALMREAKTFSSELGMNELVSGRLLPGRKEAEFPIDFGDSMRFVIAADPPDHTKLRRLVSAPFGVREVAPMEAWLRELCERLVDDLEAADGPDIISHVGWPLPVAAIARMLGIPAERGEDFKRWSTELVGGLTGELDIIGRADTLMEMFEFFGMAVLDRQASPGDDAISVLVAKGSAIPGEEPLTPQELVAFCILLLIAGNETTTNLVGNAVHAFFDHPDQWQRLVDDPTLVGVAVEEMLRFDGPVKSVMRINGEPATIGGVSLPAGARILPLFSSANRDESLWPDGDVLRIDRNPKEHVAFGYGIHQCLGAPLARLEARVLFETLARRRITLTPRGEATPIDSPILRGFASVPVSVERA